VSSRLATKDSENMATVVVGDVTDHAAAMHDPTGRHGQHEAEMAGEDQSWARAA